MCKVYTEYHGTSETEHGLCTCMVDNPLSKAWELSLPTGAQTMLYLSLRIVSLFGYGGPYRIRQGGASNITTMNTFWSQQKQLGKSYNKVYF